jgi:hypothetical protein
MKPSKAVALIALLTGIAGAALAQTAPVPGGRLASPEFAQHKQQELARITARIQAMQTLQGCVQAASDHGAIKTCNEAARASMKDRAG